MSNDAINGDLVRALAALLDETKLSEIEYEVEGVRIRVARNLTVSAGSVMAPAAAPVASATAGGGEPAHETGAVLSPMVGVAYMSPEPGAAAFVKLGDSVAEGQTLLLIEAMKTYNAIRAPRSGRITRLMVADGQPVEYGEPLLVIG